MSLSIPNTSKNDWWTAEDTPVRNDSRITFLVDGRYALLEMCLAMFCAKEYIYLANWGMSIDFHMVRGDDKRAGGDGSKAQNILINKLHHLGLSDEDIKFWIHKDLTVKNVLGYLVKKGIIIKVLLWGSFEIPFLTSYQPSKIQKSLGQVKVHCIIDKSARGIRHHQVESLHQKIAVIDGFVSFVGGVDPMIQKDDYDRWDTPSHPFFSSNRGKENGKPLHSWHDAHALLEGPISEDVESNFRQRWNDVIKSEQFDKKYFLHKKFVATPLVSGGLIQVTRTIPKYTYHFKHDSIQGIAQIYSKAFENAKKYIYLENQYIWLHEFIGIDIPFLGKFSQEMLMNIGKIADRLNEGVHVAIILPDDPNLGRIYTDAAIVCLQNKAKQAVVENRLHIFTLASSYTFKKEVQYRPIYVHSKIGIIDDLWATVGSANLNNRGMRDDTEMNVSTLDPKKAEGFRFLLWAEQLHLL